MIRILLALLLSIAACSDSRESSNSKMVDTTLGSPDINTVDPADLDDTASHVDTSKAELLATAERVVRILSLDDWRTLSEEVHPTRGVRFAPYASIDTMIHVRLSPEELREAASDSTKRLWGHYDGSGEPIHATFSAYAEGFIYDKAFVEAQRGRPDERLGQGNTLNNISEAFGHDAHFVEYYVPGSEQYSGMDWNSLRLVFAPYEEQWRLVGIVHDEWTI